MIPQSVKLAILELAHLIWHLYNRFIFLTISTYYYLLSNIEQANKTCDFITTTTTNAGNAHLHNRNLRIPKHIALCFTNEINHLHLESIARLLCWCKQLDISHITLYDDLGRLKDMHKWLIKYIELRMRAFGCDKPIDRIEGLNIISRSDGRQKFAEDMRELVEKLKPDEINIDTVDKCVGWPSDPELLISFGYPLCLHGFPPWQLRLTEILSIPTHRYLPQKVFLDCLSRYSRTSQREGV